AIGTYPIGLEDNEIEVVLYVPRNRDELDPDSQAMFRKDKYYSIEEELYQIVMLEVLDP
ncbi:22931_t:CDS:1, partial [Gigaspora rosea]